MNALIFIVNVRVPVNDVGHSRRRRRRKRREALISRSDDGGDDDAATEAPTAVEGQVTLELLVLPFLYLL